MKPYNFTLSEALEFDCLTKDDLKDAIADYEHLMKVCEDSIGTSDPAEILAVVDQLRNQEEDTLVIKNVDCKLLRQQLRELYDIPNRSEALEGVINMLEAWSDENYQETKNTAQSQPI